MLHEPSIELARLDVPINPPTDQSSVINPPEINTTERKLYIIYIMWIVLSLLYLLGNTILRLGTSFYQTCESSRKPFMQTSDMYLLFLSTTIIHIVVSARTWVWYNKIGIIGFPTELVYFYFVDLIVVAQEMITYMSVEAICPDANSWIVLFPMISYNVINILSFFCCYVHLRKRMVSSLEHLYPLQLLI